MWVNVPQEKQELVDKVVEDLPLSKINLYEFLDSDDYLPLLIRNQVTMEKYINAVTDYLDAEDETRVLRNLFLSIYISIFTQEKYDHQDYIMKIYEFFNALEDIEYSILNKSHDDFEMVKIMFEKDIELLD
jgi:hypothetical protein